MMGSRSVPVRTSADEEPLKWVVTAVGGGPSMAYQKESRKGLTVKAIVHVPSG